MATKFRVKEQSVDLMQNMIRNTNDKSQQQNLTTKSNKSHKWEMIKESTEHWLDGGGKNLDRLMSKPPLDEQGVLVARGKL